MNPHTETNRVTWRKLDRVVKEGFPEEVVFKQRPAGQDEEPRDRKEWEKITASRGKGKGGEAGTSWVWEESKVKGQEMRSGR